MADHLIDEVDEALRRERLETFWKRFGQYVVAGSIGILLLTVGAVVWQNHEASRRRAWTSAMLDAAAGMEEKKYKEMAAALARAGESADDELAAITQLWRAEMALKQENKNAAMEALEAVSSDDVYGHYASLLRLAATGEELPPKPEIFRYTALETRASRFLEDGQAGEAAPVFGKLAEDAATPQSMRERAKLLQGHAAAVSSSASDSGQ